jgi:hypothetical protein
MTATVIAETVGGIGNAEFMALRLTSSDQMSDFRCQMPVGEQPREAGGGKSWLFG